MPLLRSDEAQSIARELLYLMLDLDTEDAVEEDVGAADRVDPRGRARGGGRGRRGGRASSRTRSGRCRGSRRSPAQLTRGFLLCAVLNDVSRRRVIKFAYDEPLARPGRSAHFYDTPGCTEAASLPRRGRGAGRDARADDRA